MESTSFFWKLGALTITEYAPGGSSVKRNSPSAVVEVARDQFVSWLTASTEAFVSSAPVGSITDTAIAPVPGVCALSRQESRRTSVPCTTENRRTQHEMNIGLALANRARTPL